MEHRLTVYRRHKKTCSKGYPQNVRVFRPSTPKDKKLDCECPIVVGGNLRLEPKRLLHVSLDTTDWDVAAETVALWESWQACTDPNPATETKTEAKTIDYVTKQFVEFHGPAFKEWKPGFLKKFTAMFRLRLVPFCQAENIEFITAFDSRPVAERFVTSWRNQNPLHNRKVQPGEILPDLALSYRTKVKELERFRYFLGWCEENGWLKNNQAKKIKLKYRIPEPKFGLTPQEVDRVFDTIELLEDCHRRMNQQNYLETYAFCLVSRHTGLRINAVTNLDRTQLVRRENGIGWAIQVMAQQKSGWVRVPVPNSVYDALMALPDKGQKDGKRYWFYTGVGSLATSIKTWRGRLTRLFHKTQQPILDDQGKWTRKYKMPFEHHATPHTWRHTFAISHLNANAQIKMVSRWLGHANTTITEAHYGHANSQTNLASDAAYDESMQKQEALKKLFLVKRGA